MGGGTEFSGRSVWLRMVVMQHLSGAIRMSSIGRKLYP